MVGLCDARSKQYHDMTQSWKKRKLYASAMRMRNATSEDLFETAGCDDLTMITERMLNMLSTHFQAWIPHISYQHFCSC